MQRRCLDRLVDGDGGMLVEIVVVVCCCAYDGAGLAVFGEIDVWVVWREDRVGRADYWTLGCHVVDVVDGKLIVVVSESLWCSFGSWSAQRKQ